MKNNNAKKDFDKISGRGTTPLFRAVENGDIDKIEKLLAQGADVHARSVAPRGIYAFIYDVPYPPGSTPLHIACLAGDFYVTEILLQKKADPNARNSNDETPLDLALCNLAFYQQELDHAKAGKKDYAIIQKMANKVDDFEWTIESLMDAGATPALFAIPDTFNHKRKPGPSL